MADVHPIGEDSAAAADSAESQQLPLQPQQEVQTLPEALPPALPSTDEPLVIAQSPSVVAQSLPLAQPAAPHPLSSSSSSSPPEHPAPTEQQQPGPLQQQTAGNSASAATAAATVTTSSTRRRKKSTRAAAAAGTHNNNSDAETSPAAAEEYEESASCTVALCGSIPGLGSAVSASAPALCGTLLELHLQQRAVVDALFDVVDQMFFSPLPPGGVDEMFFNWLLAQAPPGLVKKGAPLRYADFATNRPRGEPSSLRRTMCIALKKARPSNDMEVIARSELQLTARQAAGEDQPFELDSLTAAAVAAAEASEEVPGGPVKDEDGSVDSAAEAAAAILAEAEAAAAAVTAGVTTRGQLKRRPPSPPPGAAATSATPNATKRQRQSNSLDEWLAKQKVEDPLPPKDLADFSRLDFLCSPAVEFAEAAKWSPREIAIFQTALCTYGQDFAEISNCLRTKTYKEAYLFYTQSFKQSTRYASFKFHKKLAAWYAAL